METLGCVAATFTGERAFFPNPLSVSPLVRERILQQNPPAWQANSLFAQLPWYTLFAPSIPRQFFFHKHYPQFLLGRL